jgi:hypothetical protein
VLKIAETICLNGKGLKAAARAINCLVGEGLKVVPSSIWVGLGWWELGPLDYSILGLGNKHSGTM